MFEKKIASLPVWQFRHFSDYTSISHYVSGRRGGCSKGDKSSLNLSYKVGDNPEDVSLNRSKISDAFSIEFTSLVFPEQTHSINVGIVDSLNGKFEDTDALITNVPGVCISVMSADCVPLIFYDPVKKVAAAAHAGWRGTVGKIGVKTVEKMCHSFGSDASDILVGIGPSISPEVYEVGEEVIDEVKRNFENVDNVILQGVNPGKGYLNLWEANRVQLIELGIKADHIEVAEICTYKNASEFFSARYSKNQAGRFAAGIMLS